MINAAARVVRAAVQVVHAAVQVVRAAVQVVRAAARVVRAVARVAQERDNWPALTMLAAHAGSNVYIPGGGITTMSLPGACAGPDRHGE